MAESNKKASRKTVAKKTTSTKSTAKKPTVKTAAKTTSTKSTTKKPATKTVAKTTSTKSTAKKATTKTAAKTTGTKSTKKSTAQSALKVANTKEAIKGTTRIKKAEKKSPLAKPKSDTKKVSKTKTSSKKKKQSFPFKVGEYIFYPNDGLGHITDIENLELNGEIVPYYVIHFHAQKMINRVPIHNTKLVKMRKVISTQAAKNVLKIFEKEPEKNDMSWKDRLTMYQAINEKGNCTEIAQMLVSLYYRRQSKSNLSFQERQIFDFSIGALSNELAVVLGISDEEAMHEIISRLSHSYKKTTETAESETSVDLKDV